MIIRKTFFLTIAIIIVAALSFECVGRNNNYYFKHISIENGLSQNTVLSILQDKDGFMWFGTKDGLNRFDGNSIKIFKRDPNSKHSIGNNTIWSLLEDEEGKIWVGTDRGIYLYNSANESFSKFDIKLDNGTEINTPVLDIKKDQRGNIWISAVRVYKYNTKKKELKDVFSSWDKNITPSRSWSVLVDNDQTIWASMHNMGIRKYSQLTNSVEDITLDKSGKDLSKTLFSEMVNYQNNYIIAGTLNEGLKIIDKTSGEIKSYPEKTNTIPTQLYVRAVGVFSNNLWIGTESGLYIYYPKTSKADYVYQNKNDQFSLSDNVIYSMYQDREGGIWIGTYFGGINYIPRQYNFFEKYYPVADRNSISGERISGICQDSEGNIWIGTEDAGLNKFNPKTKTFEHFKVNAGKNSLSYHNVHDVIVDGDNLWVGFFNNGIDVINLKSHKISHYSKSNRPDMLDNNDVFALYKDRTGKIWIGTSSAAFIYNKEKDQFIKQTQIGQHFISDIIEDKDGRIWFATYDVGVFRYNPRTKECKHYDYSATDDHSICFYKIISIFVDSKNRIWFTGESGGISLYNEQTDNFIRYGFKHGFASDVIYKILEDKQGNLWLSSNSGLMKFNPENNSISVFNTGNGILSNQFNYKSGFKDKDGKMYFGEINGLISFYPESFVKNSYIPPVVITGFKILDKTNSYSRDIFNKSKKITLNYNQSSFSIEFASLSYIAPEKNRYAYKMIGLDNHWVYLDKAQKLIFSNLPSGKYRFEIKASNNDGVWNEQGNYIDITINPPFWKSRFAYLIYLGLIGWGITFIFSQNTKRIKRKSENDRILFEKEKEKEIYNAKIDFFTNIAHEVRTPLTLIQSPLEYLITNNVDKKELNDNLLVMEKNTNRLLTLINQLLDFRKIEAQNFSLTFVHVDVAEILSETYIRFSAIAKQKKLSFLLEKPNHPVFADVDKEAILKILSNLTSNAIKHAKSHIDIQLSVSSNNFYIRINNDGNIIPNELKEQIFEPFFQIKNDDNRSVKSGTGIGLALVRSLVELHKGIIYLDKSITLENSFLLQIPIKQSNAITLKDTSDAVEGVDTFSDGPKYDHKEHILVVEDDEDLLSFISEKLGLYYTVFKSKNGIEAIEILEKETISIIISDVVMPLMDGLELCKKLKEDIEFSHIPFVMLTAKTTIQNKIEGLESGADAYIEKPFSMDHLYAQISNLLSNRKKIRLTFASLPLVKAGSIALNKSDEVFLNKATDVILKNISDPDFRVDQLAEALSMSRSSLLRKITGISEFSPNEFIKIVRLKRAAELLQENDYSVNEVSYLVGFSYPSYFAKSFHKQFGILPKDFIKK